jgi:hypothetical protein
LQKASIFGYWLWLGLPIMRIKVWRKSYRAYSFKEQVNWLKDALANR